MNSEFFIHRVSKADILKIKEGGGFSGYTHKCKIDTFQGVPIMLLIKRYRNDDGQTSIAIHVWPQDVPKRYKWMKFGSLVKVPRKVEMDSEAWQEELAGRIWKAGENSPGNLNSMSCNDAIRYYEIEQAYFINDEYMEFQYKILNFQYEMSTDYYLEKILARVAPEEFQSEVENCRAEVERMKSAMTLAEDEKARILAETDEIRNQGNGWKEERDELREKCEKLNLEVTQKRQELVSLKMLIERLEKKIACFNLAETLVKFDYKMVDLHNYNLPQLKQMQRQLQMFVVRVGEQIDDLETCIICMERRVNCILGNCGHAYYCMECAEQKLSKECPVCSQEINFKLRFGRDNEEGLEVIPTSRPKVEEIVEQPAELPADELLQQPEAIAV